VRQENTTGNRRGRMEMKRERWRSFGSASSNSMLKASLLPMNVCLSSVLPFPRCPLFRRHRTLEHSLVLR